MIYTDLMKRKLRDHNSLFFGNSVTKLTTRGHIDLIKKTPIHIYTDGGAKPNPGRGGWGWISFINDIEYERKYGGKEKTTNNEMEIIALISSLENYILCIDFSPKDFVVSLCIYTDSTYVWNSLVETKGEILTYPGEYTGWMKRWSENNWSNPPQKNVKLFQRLDNTLQLVLKEGLSVQVNWVKGHSGVIGNEVADQLATLGREKI